MTVDWTKVDKRNRDVGRRAGSRRSRNDRCTVFGCRNLTSAAAGKGLSQRHCRKHEDHLERHGSALHRSYSATRVNPYRRAAFDWLTAHADDTWVVRAIASIRALYENAGPMVEANRLRGMRPQDRARAAWARLRKADIDLRLPLAALLAVEMIAADDLTKPRVKEFKRVQAAKIIHRLASGTHKRWESARLDGRGVTVTEMHKFPTSRGRVLRYIGADIERAAELIVEHHLRDLCAFKAESEAAGKVGRRARPGSLKGVAKRTKKASSSPVARQEPAPPPPSPEAQPAAIPGRHPNKRSPNSVTLPDGTVVTYR